MSEPTDQRDEHGDEPPPSGEPGAVGHDPVPIVNAPNTMMAHIIKSVLDEEGIPAAVVGSNTASTLQHWGPILSVEVLVARADYGRARDAVRAALTDAAVLARCGACGYDLKGLESQERCPECGAKYVDLRQRVAISPPPGPANDPVARVGAYVGIVVVVGAATALAAGLLWMLSGAVYGR